MLPEYDFSKGVRGATAKRFLTGPRVVILDDDVAAKALSNLDEETREVVVAQLWGGLTFGEIGEMIGRSSSTAHRRYLEGSEALRKQLEVTCPK